MTLIYKRRLFALSLVLGAFVFVGCGPSSGPTGTVSGSVNLEGQPVDAGEITFVSSEGVSVSAPITSGQFKLEDALPVGKYSIGVSPPAMTEAPGDEGGNAAIPTSPVPAGYTTPGMSGLTEDIKEGANTVTVELNKSGPPAGNPMAAPP